MGMRMRGRGRWLRGLRLSATSSDCIGPVFSIVKHEVTEIVPNRWPINLPSERGTGERSIICSEPPKPVCEDTHYTMVQSSRPSSTVTPLTANRTSSHAPLNNSNPPRAPAPS